MTLFDLLNVMLTVATDGDEAGLCAVQDALRENGRERWAGYVAEETTPIRKRRVVAGLARDLWREFEEQGQKRVADAIRAVRAACPHAGETRYHPDASGNSDSWHECEDCGAEV